MDGVLGFGHFELWPSRRELRVHGHPVALGSRAFDLLSSLAERRDRVVGKDELLELVWPGLVVEENNLQVQVSALRKLLGATVIATVPGRGYRFTAVPDSPRPTPPRPTAIEVAAAPGVGHRLLVADDNKVNRLLLAHSLELMGHRVTRVEDGRQALDRLRSEPFDLLLLDLEMPGLDGFALLETMSGDPALSEVPVIITSSVEGVAPVARCIELGADDFLHKPVNPTLLKARVASSLERRRMREQQRELIGRLTALLAPPSAAGAPLAPQRGVASLLAARLRGLDVAPADDAAAVIERAEACRLLLTDAVDGQGGLRVAELGDEMVVAFGIGAVEAGDPPGPMQALRAARQMVELVEGFNVERTAPGASPVALAFGIAHGEVVVGCGGLPGPARNLCIGAVPERARALARQAEAGAHGLVVDQTVARVIQAVVRTVPLEPDRAGGAHGVVISSSQRESAVDEIVAQSTNRCIT